MSIFIAICAFGVLWPFISTLIWKREINYSEVAIQVVANVIVVAALYAASMWSALSDTEVWNGYVISKSRDHGSYIATYPCNCTTDSKGNTSCQTCSETHYTVDWRARTTVGDITFKSLDSTWPAVYKTPDPAVYRRCYKGEPASIEHTYINYVQAAGDSLFAANEALAKQFAGKIPTQPRVYNFYQYKRVIDMNNVLDAKQEEILETMLDEALKTMGASKQVNIIIIFTSIDDPNYRAAVENAWGGGEKNDVVVFVSADKEGNVKWADVMTWALNSGNEELVVTLRDELEELKTVDATTVGQTVLLNVDKLYVRPKMKDYEYLKDSIQPSTFAVVMSILTIIVLNGILTFFFIREDIRFEFDWSFINRQRRFKNRNRF